MVETPAIQSSPDLTVKVSLQHNQQSSGTKTEDVPSAVWTRARHTASGVILPTHSQKRSREALLMISWRWGHPMTRRRVDCSLRKVKAGDLGRRATETPRYTWCQMPAYYTYPSDLQTDGPNTFGLNEWMLQDVHSGMCLQCHLRSLPLRGQHRKILSANTNPKESQKHLYLEWAAECMICGTA